MRCRRFVVPLSGVLLAAGLAPRRAEADGRGIACADLAQAPVPDTRITLAQVNPAATNPPAPEHCEVVGKVGERVSDVDGKPYAITFRLRLPVDWNRRFFFQGGGGLDGFLGNALGNIGNGQTENALFRGYAVAATDSGHTAEPVPGIGGALFGLDPQARIDYGYRALDIVARTAKRVIELHYGRRPRYSYFVGCSNGGRQGMVASQRFPDHFDGIVAANPGFNLPKAAVALAGDTQAFAGAAIENDIGGQPYLPTSFSFGDLGLLANAVLNRCDALDGLVDGMIDNQPACQFDPSTLQCPGAKDATCLSHEQVTALQKVFGGARNSSGGRIYSDKPYDAGLGAPGWRVWNIGFPSAPPLTNNSIAILLNTPALAYVFVTPPDTPAANELAQYSFGFDLDTDASGIFDAAGVYTQASQEFMTATSTDLSRFRSRGSKLIMLHGASDPVFSVSDTIRWYQRLLSRTHGTAGRFARLFVIPGMNHCSGGPATDLFDQLTPLVQWVEHGTAPDKIIATANNATPWPGRTRPLCPYPKQTRYTGSGDLNGEANFVCERPHHRHPGFDHGQDD